MHIGPKANCPSGPPGGSTGPIAPAMRAPLHAQEPDHDRIRRDMDTLFKRGIVVATDGSASALRGETIAAAIAASSNRRLVIVTVSRGLSADEIRRLAHDLGDTGKARRALIAQILADASARAKDAGVVDVQSVSEHGDPAAAILTIAKREAADMIVVGKRGVGVFSELLIGSVSRTLLKCAPCAVTVVP
jgi:nucleotide-binding universal stress UspA family protein